MVKRRSARRPRRPPGADPATVWPATAWAGAVAAVSRSRRVKSRTAGETDSCGNMGSQPSMRARLEPRHMSSPRPPAWASSSPLDSTPISGSGAAVNPCGTPPRRAAVGCGTAGDPGAGADDKGAVAGAIGISRAGPPSCAWARIGDPAQSAPRTIVNAVAGRLAGKTFIGDRLFHGLGRRRKLPHTKHGKTRGRRHHDQNEQRGGEPGQGPSRPVFAAPPHVKVFRHGYGQRSAFAVVN